MIYRIDMQNFLLHAIDYLSLGDLTSIQYAIISAKITNSMKSTNVTKFNYLYPDVETILAYDETKDKSILEKMYLGMLKGDDEDNRGNRRNNPFNNEIYKAFVNPLLSHYDVMIVCDRSENDYIDVLCKYLKKGFAIEVIDLNELFTKGRIGPIYIDRDEIRDRAVDVRRAAAKEEFQNMASTRDGKIKLIGMMTKKEKLRYLKNFGVDINKNDMKDLDQMLLESWCEEDHIPDSDDDD